MDLLRNIVKMNELHINQHLTATTATVTQGKMPQWRTLCMKVLFTLLLVMFVLTLFLPI